jgi:hypothetical protein
MIRHLIDEWAVNRIGVVQFSCVTSNPQKGLAKIEGQKKSSSGEACDGPRDDGLPVPER